MREDVEEGSPTGAQGPHRRHVWYWGEDLRGDSDSKVKRPGEE